MFKKVLLCTDLSPPSELLLQAVETLKKVGLEEVLLVHAVFQAHNPVLEAEIMAKRTLRMQSQKETLENKGFKVTTEMPLGIPAPTLTETAEKHAVDAIIVGSHGKGIFKKAALGSVSTEILHRTSKPILLVRVELNKEDRMQQSFEELFSAPLFCTDFSDTSSAAFSYLEKVVETLQCPVTLMHVQDRSISETYYLQRLEDINRAIINELTPLKEKLLSLGAPEVKLEVPFGSPKELILEKVRSKKHSVVIMGSQGKGFMQELLLGSVSYSVVRKSLIPVLLIPPSQA
ncbi:universal stress protein [Heliorestis convoluta]|uniref:Universal stress family protein n=1 Tax=Heliorestis convoluta TaxID=356322 RepID=A0A5Q2MX61_9FIRM|nr:universal stress protein [Heliorestis convoluta]QGG46371.1 universal stress family protein [Heliorestis convoluta]